MSGSYHHGRDGNRHSTLVAGPSGEWGTPSPPRSHERQGLPRQPSHLAKASQNTSQKESLGVGSHHRNPFRSHHSQTMPHSNGQSSSREWASSERSSPYHAYLQSTAHLTPSTSSPIPPVLNNPFARSTSGPQPQFKAKSQPSSQAGRSFSTSGPSKAKGVSELISMFDGKPIEKGTRSALNVPLGHPFGSSSVHPNPSLNTLAAAMGQREVFMSSVASPSRRHQSQSSRVGSSSRHIAPSMADRKRPQQQSTSHFSDRNSSQSSSQSKPTPASQQNGSASQQHSALQGSGHSGSSELTLAAPLEARNLDRDTSAAGFKIASTVKSELEGPPRAELPLLPSDANADHFSPSAEQNHHHSALESDDDSQRSQTPRQDSQSIVSGPATIGLATPTSFSDNSGVFFSPSSIRSGPESPDPLNVISPPRRKSGHRQESPSTRKSMEHHRFQSQHPSNLNAAMGASMRATLASTSKRQLDDAPEPEGSAAQQRKKGRKSTNAHSPVKATNFYASSTDEASTSRLTQSAEAASSSSLVSSKKASTSQSKPSAPKPRGRPPGSKKKVTAFPTASAEEVVEHEEEKSVPAAVVVPTTAKQLLKEVTAERRGTTFTSSLRLALPVDDEFDSGSAEEWDKDSDYGMHDGDETVTVGDKTAALQTPTNTDVTPSAPRSKPSVIKSADKRSPMRRFLDVMEDLFEAESSLPGSDSISILPTELDASASDFFVLVDGIAVLKPNRIQHLSKLVRTCAANQSGRRPVTMLAAGGADGGATMSEPASIAEIDLQDMQKLMRILATTAKIGEGISPFANSAKAAAAEERGSASPNKRRGAGARNTTRSPRRPRRSKGTLSGETEEEQDAEEVEEGQGSDRLAVEEGEDVLLEGDGTSDLAASPRPKHTKEPSRTSVSPTKSRNGEDDVDTEATEEQHRQLGEQLSRIATSLMAVDCCLSIVTQPAMDKSLASEELLHSCFEMLRASLEQVIFPYGEACSNINEASHPLLQAWLRVVAPSDAKRDKKKRGRPKKLAVDATDDNAVDPSGIFAGCTEYLASILRSCCVLLSQAQKVVLLPSISLSETILYSAIYAGLGTFFAAEPDTLSGTSDAAKASIRGRKAMEALAPGVDATNTVMKSLRQPALGLLCNVFSLYSEQRQWIIEEILTSLVKLPDMKKQRKQYALHNGRAISTITALLVQLVQAASYGLKNRLTPQQPTGQSSTMAAIEVGLAASQRVDEQIDGDDDEERSSTAHGTSSSDYDLASLRKALDGPAQTSRAIATFLMGRISAMKVTKSSGDFSYASVVEMLIGDLLTTVFLPEWPASILMLSSFCRTFSSVLEDPKMLPDAKGVALEHLGTLAAHLRASQLKVDSLRPTGGDLLDGVRSAPRAMNAIEQARDEQGLHDLNHAYGIILDHLAAAEVDDHTSKSAREFLLAQWGSEVSASLIRTSAALDIARGSEEEDTRAEVAPISEYLAGLHQSLLLLSSYGRADGGLSNNTARGDVFASRPIGSYEQASQISEQLVQTTSYAVTFDFARSVLVNALDGQAVGNRTKAIRGLSAIYAIDATLLDLAAIRDAIETRLSDESIGVREAAVGLLSKYLLGQPEDMQSMYEKLRERIFDAGLAVRKRTLKLLASIYRTLPSDETRIDACIRMVRCVNDEDVGIQDLAVQTLGEIWLNLTSSGEDADDVRPAADGSNANPAAPSDAKGLDAEEHDVCGLDNDMAVIVRVAGAIRERPSPLEEVFRRFSKERSEEESKKLVAKLQSLSDRLIIALDEGEDSGDTATLLTKVKAIYLVVSTNPAVLSIAKAKVLLSQLRGSPQTPDEASVLETLLKVFRVSLPVMPKTALAFAGQLEAALRPLLNNPPRQMAALQEVIACYTTIIQAHTESYSTLVRTFGLLFKALSAIAAKLSAQPDSPVDRKSRMIMSEAALLCEHANFDALRKQKPELEQEINDTLGSESIKDAVFLLLLAIRQSPTHRSVALQDIGTLFRGFPLLMIEDKGMEVMDAAFGSEQNSDKEMLLRIILDFLTTDSAKRAPTKADAKTISGDATSIRPGGRKSLSKDGGQPTRVDMSELVGNTDNFADSGVSSILVQRYLDPILNAAVAVGQPGLQRPAMEILKFIIMQGLCHPLQCMPTLISLETTTDSRIANRALQLHEHLASKHGSILAARYGELIKSSFEFQWSLHQPTASQQDLRGYRIDAVTGLTHALLHPWYSLLKDKRQTRLDFLKAMSKFLDLDTSSDACTDEQVLLSRYIADNLAVFEYKTLEEVLVVIADLKKILAVSGAQVKYLAEEYVATAEQGSDAEAMDVDEDGFAESEPNCSDEAGDDESGSDLGGTQHDLRDAGRGSIRGNGRGNTKALSKPQSVAVARMSIVMGTVLLLRNQLKAAFGLSEERCCKYEPKKKQFSGADRPAVRKGGNAEPLSFDGLPLALDVISSRRLALEQMANFEDLMDNEGSMAEMDEDWEE
ncbi:hypothetical protein BCV69DRAFT_283065 [Microstroma glucosiphilum]|uniref:Sister chromatid cohesion protein n=1 Tax=Pseudomicrostroma glucosiphilum TaxID=1684307 RepID=A0A316U7P4_9BASI|nr:hypothetical protein BCV69DRAFT_283065 [Pseudomicrostroma glucosiphilum]PWN20858.1 hypothetical protein BCV69DRAFT_283065 [Pseudomicrostroma glucosiphilum]